MPNYSKNTKRIAKNTIFLYIRMMVMMLVSLFTFRELLKLLGVEDYGIYNVVGGVVILFSFISNAMTQANQRFLAFHIGIGKEDSLNKVFSMIVNVQLIVASIIFLLSESVGLWFLNNKMNFPQNTMLTVNWLYQLSIITFIIHLLQIPYTSAIIAYERMSFFSYLSIGEAFLKLGIVLLLSIFTSHRLIVYGILLLLSAIIICTLYYTYSRKTFPICSYMKFWEKSMFKEIISFSSWNMLGGIANVGASQGVNIIYNIFCGVLVNAAMGVSNQVSAAVSSFVTNIQTAFNPQIIKSYAANDRTYFDSLIFRSSRFSFLLVFMIGFPVVLCCHTVFCIWLTDIPQYAESFTQLIIIYCMIDSLSGSLWTAAQATGKIKNYMIIISGLIFTNIPAAYLILHLDYSPVYVMCFKVLINILVYLTRIGYLYYIINFPVTKYLKKVIRPIFYFIILTIPIPIIGSIYSISIQSNLILILSTISISAIIGFLVVLTKTEKNFIIDKLYRILRQTKASIL